MGSGNGRDRLRSMEKKRRGRKGKGASYDFGEVPMAYKNIETVIEDEIDLIQPIVRLTPLAVIKG